MAWRFLQSALILSLLTTSAAGQEFFRNWRVEDGLADAYVGDIERDELGYLWIATRYGLNRFDGNRFTWFGEDSSAGLLNLGNSRVECLAAGTDGDMWIGAGEIKFYDSAKESFTTIRVPLQRPDEIVKKIAIDQARSRVWAVGNRGAIWCLDANSLELIATHSLADGQTGGSRVSLYVEPDGRILVGHRLGMARIDLDGNYKEFANVDTAVTEICASSEGDVFISTDNGLHRLGPDDKLSVCDQFVSEVGRIACDQNGRVLIGMRSGLSIYDPVTNKAKKSFSRRQ
jgi:ligand-binding sensor domain-containing protein